MMDPTQNRGWLAMDKMYMAIRNSQQARKHHKLPSYIVAYDLGPCTRQENFLSGREMLSNEQQILVRQHKTCWTCTTSDCSFGVSRYTTRAFPYAITARTLSRVRAHSAVFDNNTILLRFISTQPRIEQNLAKKEKEGALIPYRPDGIAGGHYNLVCVWDPHVLEVLLVLQQASMPSPHLLQARRLCETSEGSGCFGRAML